jgi:glutathione synthase/RimK-type ligase-like ATP-grasp enzyme
MILILSWPDDQHVPYVTRHLEARGAPYVWLHPSAFPAAVAARASFGRGGLARRVIRQRELEVDLDQVTAVWLRRPGRPSVAAAVTDECQREWAADTSRHCLAGLWDTLGCLWVPGPPRVNRAGHSKARQLALAARLGFRVPRTQITNSPEAVLDFYASCHGRMVTKVLWDGHVPREGEIAMAYTRPVRRRDAASYRAVRYAPLILQEYVPKQFELRCTVVDTQVFAAAIQSQASRVTRHDWRHYDNERATYSAYDLPAEVAARCVALTRALGLCFGAIDLVVTPAGEHVFLEVNPNGQWAWVEDLTGLPIAAALTDLLARGAAGVPESGDERDATGS